MTMKNEIIYCILFLCLVGCRHTYKEYKYSKDGKNRLTIIQSDKDGIQGLYLTLGDFKGEIPEKDFVFLEYSDFAIYAKWENDTLFLRTPGWSVIKKSIDTQKFNFGSNFTREELTKLGYYTSRFGPKTKEDEEQFYKNKQKEYLSFTRFDIAMNWGLWWK